MNIEIANRLVQMRKKMGLSQEQLADKLGLSRQAVSKWERAEASPDTDNLICLAKLYGVSLDELLSTEDSEETIVEEQIKPQQEETNNEERVFDDDHISINSSGIHLKSEDGDSVEINSSGIHFVSKDGKKTKIKRKTAKALRHDAIQGCISGLTVFLSVIAYILLGTLIPTVGDTGFSMWGYAWIVFLLIPFVACLVETIFKKRWGPLTGCVAMLSVAGFMTIGVLAGAWHPGWVIFLAIPVYGTVAGSIDSLNHPNDPDGDKEDFLENRIEEDE